MATNAEFLVPEPVFQPLFTALERLVDGFRAGRQSPLQCGECKADGAATTTGQLVSFAHFRFHVIRDRFVQGGFAIGKRVVDRVRLGSGNSGVPSNLTSSSFTILRMRSDASTL